MGARDIAIVIVLITRIIGSTPTMYALAADRPRRLLQNPKAVRRLDRGAGVCLVGTGLVIAAES